jgi:hypothetical protein
VPRRLALTALAAATLGAAPAGALGAVAAIQDDRLAATPAEQVEQRLNLSTQTGARVARVDLFWSDIAPNRPANPTDPNDPAYDWRAADAKIAGYHRRGVSVIVSVYSTPAWSSKGRRTEAQYNPYAPAAGDYGRFLTAAAKRYSGRFTPAVYGTRPLPRVRNWEIWNEPNLRLFFRVGNSSSLPAYIRLLREAYPAIKGQIPGAVVIAGVAGPRSSGGDGSIGARTWLRGIANSALSVRFDAYSQHIYPAAAPVSGTRAFPSWNSIDEILATLDARRAREIRAARGAARRALQRKPKMKLYITEAGYTTARTPYRNVRVTPAVQAQRLRQLFNLRQVRTPRVPVIVWFNLQDNRDWPGGLLYENLRRKPAWAAFRAVARRGALPAELRR